MHGYLNSEAVENAHLPDDDSTGSLLGLLYLKLATFEREQIRSGIMEHEREELLLIPSGRHFILASIYEYVVFAGMSVKVAVRDVMIGH